MIRTANRKGIATVIAALLLASLGEVRAATEAGKRPSFDDVKARTTEFIGWSSSIRLTPEQEKVKRQALGSIPAPCCKEYSIATCCCPCNLAKSTWGLSKLLIAQHGLNTPQVRAAVDEWLGFIGHGGFTGDACFTRGCNRAFDHNGCGGMDDTHIG